jgi:DNA topoisomerase-2
MNFLHHFYPSLLKIPGFLVEFITPIIKVRVVTWLCVEGGVPSSKFWCELQQRGVSLH